MNSQTSQEGYIPVTGGRVWYRKEGEGPGIPLLTLHGGPGAASDYLKPLLALADERPVILYDQLGAGRSDRPDDPCLWVLERFVEELMQVRAALGMEKFHLLGHSWGTILGIEYALTQPTGLTSLILSGPALSAPRYVQEANRLKSLLPAEMQEAIVSHEAAGTIDSPEYQAVSGEWLRRHVCRDEAILQEVIKTFTDPKIGINPVVYNTMQGPSEFTIAGNLKDWDRTERLSEIHVPTLFTCGRYDECTPEATEWYSSLLPGSEMVVFENSAHMHHLEETDRYLRVVRDFLKRAENMKTV